jgi:hypothetical protein
MCFLRGLKQWSWDILPKTNTNATWLPRLLGILNLPCVSAKLQVKEGGARKYERLKE